MRLIMLSAAVAAMILTACNNTGKLSGGSSEPTTRMDSISYALGSDLGNNLKKQDIEINPEALLEGMQATFNEDGEPVLTDQEARMMLMLLQQQVQSKQPTSNPQNPQRQQSSAISVGQEAPEISLPTPDGAALSLSDLRGDVVLIDFWASWCKPCRLENPNVVKVYEKYKDKGFEILGVSLDRNKEAWTKAIAQDGLTWKHVSDLKFWNSQAAVTYGVKAIPYTVLIDREGKVIAERLRGGNLEATLAQVLGE